ncbi:peroxidase 27-like [Tripterygium wilfordii]|nr:peroxidase 27-like [Tripterygium wilfordii]
MATSKAFSGLFLLSIFLLSVFNLCDADGLKVGFYEKTCPQAEAIVEKVIGDALSIAPTLSGPILRMHFHDCFVRGCDGSLLLESPTKQAERDAIPNQSIIGFAIIDKVKSALEKACPGVVSCADLLAIAARDVTVATGGETWKVETGRRDGRVSNITEALLNLFPPFANITQLITGFQLRGLTVKDLVVLSGSHTIGTSVCAAVSPRLYNFTGKGDTDPTLDPNYAIRLKSKCKPGDLKSRLEMDPGSFKTFDTSYYNLVAKRRGLFNSDSALLDNSETRAYVLQATSHESDFLMDFGVSMVKMGRIEVLTGKAGEIRRVCTKVN